MSSPALLWIDAVWLLILAFLALVVYREYALLRTRIELEETKVSDGPEIGSLAPRGSRSSDDRVYLFLFGDCGACHELAAKLNRTSIEIPIEIAVGDGVHAGSGADLLDSIKPLPGVTVISGAQAERRRLAFGVNSGPFAIVVRNDVVSSKGYPRDSQDLRRMASLPRQRELIAIDVQPNRV
jgi:hypothetical protein